MMDITRLVEELTEGDSYGDDDVHAYFSKIHPY